MSLLDSTNYQIKSITNTIKNTINTSLNSSIISYGFIGMTTAILGYYTFFENDIEIPMPENLMPENSMPENSMPENLMPENLMPENKQSSQFGGKKIKTKHTRKRGV